MKHLLYTMHKASLLFIFSFLSLTVLAQGVVFEKNMSFEQALIKAKSESKLIFVEFYTDDCDSCKLLNALTLTDMSIAALFNHRFINLKINGEEGAGITLFSKYNVTTLPTLLFVDSKGELVQSFGGFLNAPELLSNVKIMTKAQQYGGIEKMVIDFKTNTRNEQQFLTDLFDLLPEEHTLRAEVANRSLLHFPEDFLKSDRQPDILYIRKLLYALDHFDPILFDRILKIFKDKYDEGGRFSANYDIGVVFIAALQIHSFLLDAIQENNREVLEKLIHLKKALTDAIHTNKEDGDVYIYSGRRLYYASSNFIRLRFLSENRKETEFAESVVPFLDSLMSHYSIEEIHKKNLVRDGELNRKANFYSLQRASDISAQYILDWAAYYWRISPNNQITKALTASWLNFACQLNPYRSKTSIEAAPLLVKLGYVEDAIKNLEATRSAFPKGQKSAEKYLIGVTDMLETIKRNKL